MPGWRPDSDGPLHRAPTWGIMSGTLEPGKLAGMTVCNANPYAMIPAQMAQATIEITFIGGRVV